MAIGNPITLTSNVASKTISVIATAGQTLFTVTGGYRINQLAVFRNGVRLLDSRDYEARNGSTVTLLSAATVGDALEFQVFDDFRVADAIVSAESEQTIQGNLTVSGGMTVAGLLTATDISLTDVSLRHLVATGISTVSDTTQATSTTTGAFIVSGGVGIAKSLFVGGDMSVAGTLTYEDVTNTETAGITTTGGLVVTGLGATFGSGVGIADSIYHIGDDNTAIRFPAADTFTVETGGSESLRVDSSQRLLINKTASTTSNGHSILQVASTSNDRAIAVHNFENDANGPFISLGKSRGTSVNSYTIVQDDDELGNIDFFGADGTDFSTVGARIQAEVDGSPGTNDLPGRLIFATTADGANSPTERVRITSAGRMGLGCTPDTTADFHIRNSNAANLKLGGSGTDATGFSFNYSNSGNTTTTIKQHYRATSASALLHIDTGTFTLATGTSNTERLRIDSSGRLLIGTTSLIDSSTASNFQIANASGPRLCIARNDTSTASGNLIGALDFYGNDSDGTYENCGRILCEADADHTTDSKLSRLTFYTAGSDPDVAEERLRIDSNGNIGVNQTSINSSRKMEITQPASYTSGLRINSAGGAGNGAYFEVFVGSANYKFGGDHNTNALLFKKDGTEYMRHDSSGRLLIGANASGGSGAELQIASSDAHKVQFHRGVASSGGPNINISKSRNTSYGSNTIVQSGDSLGVIRFLGDDGTNLDTSAARILCQVDGTPGENDMPGRLIFETTADGASSETERLRIDSRGSFQFSNGFMNETVNINSTARNGTQAVNLDDGMVHYFTSSATGTWKPNFTMSSGNDINATIATGDTFSVTMIVNKSNTAHYADSVQVDGTDRTIEWLGGAPTAGGGNNTFDVYSYTIIKTGNDTFIAFASVSIYE